MRIIHYDTARRLAQRALEKGAHQVSLTTIHWDISGNCEAPTLVSMAGRPEPLTKRSYKWKFDPLVAAKRLKLHAFGHRDIFVGTYNRLPIFVDIEARCRKCESCMNTKRVMWKKRAEREITASERTWFATLTINPHHHYKYRCDTISRLQNNGVDFDLLSKSQQHRELVRTIGADITKYFKRLRKNTGAVIRYLLVSEPHKSGLPHFHALIHDTHPERRLRKADLEREWKYGFTKFKLVDKYDLKSAHYVTKYVSKSLSCRIRSSIRYGNITAFAIDLFRGGSGDTSPETQSINRANADHQTTLFGTVLKDYPNVMAKHSVPDGVGPSSVDIFDPRTWGPLPTEVLQGPEPPGPDEASKHNRRLTYSDS